MNSLSFHSHGFVPIGNYTLCSQMVLGKGATGTVFRGIIGSTQAIEISAEPP